MIWSQAKRTTGAWWYMQDAWDQSLMISQKATAKNNFKLFIKKREWNKARGYLNSYSYLTLSNKKNLVVWLFALENRANWETTTSLHPSVRPHSFQSTEWVIGAYFPIPVMCGSCSLMMRHFCVHNICVGNTPSVLPPSASESYRKTPANQTCHMQRQMLAAINLQLPRQIIFFLSPLTDTNQACGFFSWWQVHTG